MKKLQMPSSYAVLSAEEQSAVCGGGELGDALGSFFNNLHLEDFFYGGGLISFSFTFVPMLLFRVVKVGIQTGVTIYNQITRLLGLTGEAANSAIQYVDDTQQKLRQNDPAYTPSVPTK